MFRTAGPTVTLTTPHLLGRALFLFVTSMSEQIQSPLEWLGGPEGKVLAEKNLQVLRQLLLGEWMDQSGSIYSLSLSTQSDQRVDVKTQRPTGLLLIKRALLVLQADADGVCCRWGNGRFVLAPGADGLERPTGERRLHLGEAPVRVAILC